MNIRRNNSKRSSERGSALLVALCLSSVFAICLTSYISLCYTQLGVSNRNLGSNHGVELAEAGMEQALWAVNNSYGAGWTVSGTSEVYTQSGFAYDNGASGQFTITVANYATNPSITSVGSITMQDGSIINRTLTAATSQVPAFVNAVGAVNGRLKFKTTGSVDSYNSALGAWNATTNSGTSAIVLSGSISTSSATISLGTATIKGYVITESGSHTPTISSATVDSTKVLVSGNPNQPVFNETTPDLTSASYLSSLTSNTTIGSATATTTQVYYVSSDFTTNSYTLTVKGPVVLKINGDLTVPSGGGIVVSADKVGANFVSSLEIHIRGSTSLGGNGVNNLTLLPSHLALVNTLDGADYDYWGDPIYQTESISTTTAFYGVMYFPNDALTISSALTVYGSVVAKSVSMNSTATIHYDMALRSVSSGVTQAAFNALTESYSVNTLSETH